MSDVSNFVRTSQTTTRDEINKILSLLNPLSFPDVENTSLKERITYVPEVRERTTSVITGYPNKILLNAKARASPLLRRRAPVAPLSSHPLIYTITGTESAPANNTKFGGRGDFNGSSYITITTDALLNPTAEITIALWIYSPATSADGIIVAKNNQYELKFTSANGISWRTYSGGAWRTARTTTFTPNTWTHIVATYKSTASGQKLYKDNVLVSSDALTGALGTSTNNLGIGSSPGTSTVINGTRFAILSMLSSEANTTWIANHFGGYLDMKTYGEITTIPFFADWTAQPNTTSNYFKSG